MAKHPKTRTNEKCSFVDTGSSEKSLVIDARARYLWEVAQ